MSEPRKGHYLGTEVNEAWWSRYTKEGFFARGAGEWWLDGQAFHFRRHLTNEALCIPLAEVRDVKLGAWHAGRWCLGRPIVKVIWEHAGLRLSSGFLIAGTAEDAGRLAQELSRSGT